MLSTPKALLAIKVNVYPKKMLILNLIEFIAETINTGREIILAVMSNEHIVECKIDKQLKTLV